MYKKTEIKTMVSDDRKQRQQRDSAYRHNRYFNEQLFDFNKHSSFYIIFCGDLYFKLRDQKVITLHH